MKKEEFEIKVINYCLENKEETIVSYLRNPSVPYLKNQKDIIKTIKDWANNKGMKVKWIKVNGKLIYKKEPSKEFKEKLK